MLVGEARVGKCIPDMSTFYCRIQAKDSQQSHTEALEQVQNWRELICRLLEHSKDSDGVFITNNQPTSQEG